MLELCLCVVVSHTRGRMLVIVSRLLWTQPTTAASVGRHASCPTLVSFVALICATCLPVSRLLMSMDEHTCLVMASRALHAVLIDSLLNVDTSPLHGPFLALCDVLYYMVDSDYGFRRQCV